MAGARTGAGADHPGHPLLLLLLLPPLQLLLPLQELLLLQLCGAVLLQQLPLVLVRLRVQPLLSSLQLLRL